MKRQALSVFTIALLVVHSGCGVDSETMESLQTAVNAVSTAQTAVDSSKSFEGQGPQVAQVQFVPKYPNRVDPFTFPNDAELGDIESTPMATVAEIEVLGFANVGEAHVLLRSGETAKSLRVGESISGIRVIAINPPTTQLQMGTLVWTATMFDKSDNN